MRTGFVGLGKLGLPVATAMASRGLEIHGYDPHVLCFPDDLSHEADWDETATVGTRQRIRFHSSLKDVVENADVIFVATQTPHEARFEGVTPLPRDRADFDYRFLKRAVQDIALEAVKQRRDVTLAVISTVLPGTMEREILPLLPDRVRLVYNPSFIAMGTTIRDFLDPEFVLLGGDPQDVGRVANVYSAINPDPSCLTTGGFRTFSTEIRNAELIKVSYNTFIGLKIAFANTLMEVCHKTGCDVDAVTGALRMANRRLISGAYLDGGMGDGGGCHPRDNIALSWMARELDLSYDLFGAAMEAREAQAEWLCDLMEFEARARSLPLGILGIAYKPGSHIVTGSAAKLVYSLLVNRNYFGMCVWDPYVREDWVSAKPPTDPAVFLVGCKHPLTVGLPEGSVVIDPFRSWPDQQGVEVIRLGIGTASDHGAAEHGAALRRAA